MLSYIFKNQFIQSLRHKGCSKKQAIKIHDKFVTNLLKDGNTVEGIANYALTYGSQFNYHLISGAFAWGRTSQGQNYWAKVSEVYKKFQLCKG